MNWYEAVPSKLRPPFHIGYYLMILLTNINTHTNYMNLSIVKERTEAQKAQQRRSIILKPPISSTPKVSLMRQKSYPPRARIIRERRIIYASRKRSTVISWKVHAGMGLQLNQWVIKVRLRTKCWGLSERRLALIRCPGDEWWVKSDGWRVKGEV